VDQVPYETHILHVLQHVQITLNVRALLRQGGRPRVEFGFRKHN